MDAFTTEPYLVTVTGDGRPHCSVVTVDWDAARQHLVVRAPSGWAESDASGYRRVTLLWPPVEPGGNSLIVDGTAETAAGDETSLAIRPTRAVLHRRAPAAAGGGVSSGPDCVPVLSS